MCEKIADDFNLSTNARSKLCFRSMSVVSFHSWLNSLSGISFVPKWKSLFLHLSDHSPRNRLFLQNFFLWFLCTMSRRICCNRNTTSRAKDFALVFILNIWIPFLYTTTFHQQVVLLEQITHCGIGSCQKNELK